MTDAETAATLPHPPRRGLWPVDPSPTANTAEIGPHTGKNPETPMPKLTAKQHKCLVRINNLIAQGKPPSIRELAASLEVSSGAASQQITRLTKLGMISRKGRKARSISMTDAGLAVVQAEA